MDLEDHVGDIIRKARVMAGVTAEAAARTAGLSDEALEALEESGEAAPAPDYAALEALLGLRRGRLGGIAAGWLPARRELSQWRQLRVITTTAEGMGVNCFLAWDEATREAALFDTGWEADPILDLTTKNELNLRHVFITHSHEDHVAALDPLLRAFPLAQAHRGRKPARADLIPLGSLRIGQRDTPGHAQDGVSYIISAWPDGAPQAAVVGDALFAGSMGRGNISWELARAKVREHILSLPPETLICPGHGPLTTVGEEQAHNPFF